MRFHRGKGTGKRTLSTTAAILCGSLITPHLAAAQAQEKAQTYVMKIGIPTINDGTHQFAKNFAAAIERDTGGRIKPQVYPGSQLGAIPRMIEGAQFGSIECIASPPEFFAGVEDRK